MYLHGQVAVDDFWPSAPGNAPNSWLSDSGPLLPAGLLPGISLGALDLGHGAAVRGPPPGLEGARVADTKVSPPSFDKGLISKDLLAPCQPCEIPAPNEHKQPPWIVEREGAEYCLLCRRWSDMAHIASKQHTKRAMNPDWYLWEEEAEGADATNGGEGSDPWADAAASQAAKALRLQASSAPSGTLAGATPILKSGQEIWHGGPPPPPPPPRKPAGACGPVGSRVAGIMGPSAGQVPQASAIGLNFPNHFKRVEAPVATTVPGQVAQLSGRNCAWCGNPGIERTIPGSKARYCSSCWSWWQIEGGSGLVDTATAEPPPPQRSQLPPPHEALLPPRLEPRLYMRSAPLDRPMDARLVSGNPASTDSMASKWLDGEICV